MEIITSIYYDSQSKLWSNSQNTRYHATMATVHRKKPGRMILWPTNQHDATHSVSRNSIQKRSASVNYILSLADRFLQRYFSLIHSFGWSRYIDGVSQMIVYNKRKTVMLWHYDKTSNKMQHDRGDTSFSVDLYKCQAKAANWIFESVIAMCHAWRYSVDLTYFLKTATSGYCSAASPRHCMAGVYYYFGILKLLFPLLTQFNSNNIQN